MTLNFRFHPTASIDHLNIRKEGSERDILAIDIKLSGDTDSTVLAAILGCGKAQARNFWNIKSEEKPILFNGISKITAWSEFDNCEVAIGARKFKGARVRRFAFQPQSGMVIKLECQVTVSDIHDSDVSYLCEHIRDDINVTIGSHPDLFDSKDSENE